MMHYSYSAVAAALLTHLGVQYQEPSALQAVSWGIVANVGIGSALVHKHIESLASIGPVLLRLNVVYLSTLFLSIFLYRGFYHPLRSYPGPFLARITKFWTCRIHLEGEYHREVRELHKKYDDIMRVGPNELDINNVEAIRLLYGTASKCLKGPWYDGPAAAGDTRSIQSTRDPKIHRWRRGIWAQSNSVAAINDFQPTLLKHIEGFLSQMSAHEEIDIGQWFTWLSFDIMGDLAFGEAFDNMKTLKSHRFMTILHGFMKMLSILGAVPWLTSLLDVIPAGSDVKEFEKIASDCVKDRRARGSNRKDIFYYLLGEDKETGSRLNERELVMDSRTAIVGGSDTTSISLGCLFYYLVRDQDRYKKLQTEILQHPEPADNTWLSTLPYLNACIHEGLRLMPPVPQGLQRVTPPEGIQVAGKYIPGGTLVSVSPFTIQRDSRNFVQPDDFIPERWLPGGPEPCNKDAWIPFSTGHYGCIGKQLAWSELRHITSAVVRNYDLHFAPTFDVEGFEKSVKNDFTMTPPSVKVVSQKRS